MVAALFIVYQEVVILQQTRPTALLHASFCLSASLRQLLRAFTIFSHSQW